MNEENFSLQSTLEGNYLNIALPAIADSDEIAVRVMEQDCPDFLIPFRIVTVNGNTSLKYKLINTVALAYSERSLSKKQFIQLFMNLLTPFMKGKDWFLNYHNLCIDPQYIFMNKMDKNISFIYIPEKSYCSSDGEIKEFFKKLFTEITISDDPGFQVKMFRYFGNEDSNLADLYQLLLQEQRQTGTEPVYVSQSPKQEQPVGQQVQSQTFAQPTPQVIPQPVPEMAVEKKTAKTTLKHSLFASKKEEHPENAASEVKAVSPDLFGRAEDISDSDAALNALFGDAPKKKKEKKEKEKKEKKEGGFALFGKKKEQPQQATTAASFSQPKTVPSVSPVSNNGMSGFGTAPFQMMGTGDDDRTEIAGEEYSGQGACLELIESAVPGAIPRISLNFAGPFITIGRTSSDEIQPDVAFSREFSRIGRMHARVERSGGGFCIIDLGSANHTLVNGQILIPNQPYPLPDGGEVTFTTTKPVKYRIHL